MYILRHTYLTLIDLVNSSLKLLNQVDNKYVMCKSQLKLFSLDFPYFWGFNLVTDKTNTNVQISAPVVFCRFSLFLMIQSCKDKQGWNNQIWCNTTVARREITNKTENWTTFLHLDFVEKRWDHDHVKNRLLLLWQPPVSLDPFITAPQISKTTLYFFPEKCFL